MLGFAIIVGLAVTVSIFVDGVGFQSLLMLATWLSATWILWSIPVIAPRFGMTREVLRDERDRAILREATISVLVASGLYFFLACWAAWRRSSPS